MIGLALVSIGAGRARNLSDSTAPASGLNRIAEAYVKLVLAVGQHDQNYVDAYYGPEAWQDEAKLHKVSLKQISSLATSCKKQLRQIRVPHSDEMLALRYQYLKNQLRALIARVEMLQGKKMTFDEESHALYDAIAPTYPESHFKQLLDKVEALIPGNGSLQQRYEKFRRQFVIPQEKLDTVFAVSLQECRRRTKSHIVLPPNESFTVEYVTGKSWGAYNWYKGNSHSVIQVNTDIPTYVDRVIDLAAHEGYPGHHVYNVLLEENLLTKRNWIEFSVYPLYSPQSLIAEGSANYGVEVAFPGKEQQAFERAVLFPLAGLDTTQAEAYYKIQELLEKLSYAGNEAACRYLNGEIDREAAVQWHMKYRLATRERAEKSVRFIEQYRSYVINYTLGKDLVKQFIEKRGGTVDSPEKRWTEFARLLSSPRLPSGLK